MEYSHYAPVYHDITGRETQPSTSHTSIAQENDLRARSMQASASQASCSSSQSFPDPVPVDTGKRSNERWSDDEEKMLINLWAENFERINSSQARKAWDGIAKQMNLKFETKRASERFQNKIKNLIERCKICKDGNSKQTGGNLRTSSRERHPTSTRLMQLLVAAISSQDIVNVKEAAGVVSRNKKSRLSKIRGIVLKKRRQEHQVRRNRRDREKRKTENVSGRFCRLGNPA